MKSWAAAAVALAMVCSNASAMSSKTWADSGKAVAYAMPVFAAGVAISKKDWAGVAQLAIVTTLTYGTAYGLKHVVRECRPFARPCTPGGPDWDSFPSTTSAIASAPSSFLWQRYGWEWGLPAFVVSKYPSFALDKAKQNRIWDGLASTAIAWAYNGIFTPRYEERGFHTDVEGDSRSVYLKMAYRW